MNSNQFQLQYINPLRGLTETRVVSLLELAERGAYAELQWLYRFVEKRYPAGRAVKRRLLSAIGKLQWHVKAPDCGDDAEKQAMADAQKETLRAAYDQVRNLRPALNFLALAELRGFAHLEKIYAGSLSSASQLSTLNSQPDPWAIVELRIVPQWFWVRDGIYGDWQYNAAARIGTFTGTAVDAARFLVREIEDPIGEIMAKLYVRLDNSDADWDGALEDFGIPPTIIEGPPNVSPEKEAEYKREAENIASGAKGYIPNGAKVHNITPLSGASVFLERLNYLDGQLVIAATSGKLTVLTESGSGTLAGSAQADAFDAIAESIAQEISGVMNDGFDREVLARAHPGEPPLAYFEFAAVDNSAGTRALDDAVKANTAGYAIAEDELSEKSGYTLTRVAAATPSAQLPTPNVQGAEKLPTNAEATQPRVTDTPGAIGKTAAVPSPAPADARAPLTPASLANATAAQLGVTPEYLAPAAAELAALIAKASDGTIANADFIAEAEAMLKKLPLLAKMMDATGIATSLEAAMRDAAETALQTN